MATIEADEKTGRFETEVTTFAEGVFEKRTDVLAIEDPLEIRLGISTEHRAVSITMRTPGFDAELAAGFLFTEGILTSPDQVTQIKHCGKFPNNKNTIRVDLADDVIVDFKKLERNFYTTSSCGVCGKTSLEALTAAGAKAVENRSGETVSPQTINALPVKLRQHQTVFDETGGLHAAALFGFDGEMIDIKEDVGRHNAVDKVIGQKFLEGRLPLNETILFLSGRASFELVQKAVMAGIPMICAVGAPSSLAVESAREFGVTLLGFIRENRFNVYNDSARVG